MTLPRIKDIRQSMHMTQAEFSAYLNTEKGVKISRGTIAKYESGVNFPSPETIQKLSKALNVSEFYLSGYGTKKENIEEKLINLLHQKFFNSSDYTDELHQLLKNYLLFIGDYNKPLSYYQNSDGIVDDTAEKAHFPRFSAINNFWKKEFNFLFDNSSFVQSLIGTTNDEFNQKVLIQLKRQYDLSVDHRNFDILIEEIDKISQEIQITASNVINNKESKKELLQKIDMGIKKLTDFKNHLFD